MLIEAMNCVGLGKRGQLEEAAKMQKSLPMVS